MKNNAIKVDKKRLASVCLRSYKAFEEKRGIFKDKRKIVLPQWNLPLGQEDSSGRIRNSEETSFYFWAIAPLERKSLTKVNIRNSKRLWGDVEKRWFFNPREVARRDLSEIAKICSKDLQYTFREFPLNYLENCKTLLANYEGDPRKTIMGFTTKQARENLTGFKGIGDQIASLFMIYMGDRGLVLPVDPEEARVKVDVHKVRIPLNTGCIITNESRIRRERLLGPLGDSYLEICKEHALNAHKLDAALWIPGSQLCIQRDYRKCTKSCPIEELCISNIPRRDKDDMFLIYETDVFGNRKRVDTRKYVGQTCFGFHKDF